MRSGLLCRNAITFAYPAIEKFYLHGFPCHNKCSCGGNPVKNCSISVGYTIDCLFYIAALIYVNPYLFLITGC